MSIPRFARCLICLAFPFVAASGCQVLHSYRPVAVLVRDAETKKPISDAELHISYPLTRNSLAPCDSSARSGADGIARVSAAPYGHYGVSMEAKAAGYQSENRDVSAEAVGKVPPAHLFEDVEKRPANLTVELYAEPRFAVELIVPNDYRGLIKTSLQIDDDASFAVGQRCFRYEFSPPSSVVVIKGPAILRRVSPSDYKACYAKGEQVGDKMDLVTVGFRWLMRDGNDNYFVIGTRNEYDQFRRRLRPKRAGADNDQKYAEEAPHTHSGKRGRR